MVQAWKLVALDNSTVDSPGKMADHDALFLMCVLDMGFGAVSQRFILCIGGQLVVTWEFQKQFIMGDKLACLSNIQPNEK